MVKLGAIDTPAKINLFLRITGRRADGYHELDSVFAPIELFDRVQLEIRPSQSAAIELTCDGAQLPLDSRNLAWRAAESFLKEFGISARVRIALGKNIPAGAGLGGGSSDAAAVLQLLSSLSGRAGDESLNKIALSLGADVPFFLDPKSSHVTGIGETRLPIPLPQFHLVLAVPPIEVPTAKVYAGLKRNRWSGPTPDAHLDVLRRGAVSSDVLVNDLEASASALFPEITLTRQVLESVSPLAVSMSGSGGTVFAIFADATAATAAADEARGRLPDSFVIATRTTAATF